jgi:hypothetical protein
MWRLTFKICFTGSTVTVGNFDLGPTEYCNAIISESDLLRMGKMCWNIVWETFLIKSIFVKNLSGFDCYFALPDVDKIEIWQAEKNISLCARPRRIHPNQLKPNAPSP